MKKGICRICGEHTLLSFEHVPPRVAFNKNTKYTDISFDEYLQVKNPLKDKMKGKKKQGGIGYNSLCKSCNSFLGSNYVEAYRNWAQGGFEVLNNGKNTAHIFRIREQQPLKILKQIISMFLSINGEWYREAYPELTRFVKDPQTRDLPEKFRVMAYLNHTGLSRYLGHSVIYKPELGGPVSCSEIAYPPFGYVLTFDFYQKVNALTDITYFKNFDKDEVRSLTLLMFNLPTHLPLPFDYRSKEEIEKHIMNGNKRKI